MMRFKSIVLILFLIISYHFKIHADDNPFIEHITTNNGLTQNTIRCMLQDKTGFMWFGSLYGINRYDGIKIKAFKPEIFNASTLTIGKIKELHEDTNGHIWMRTYSDMMQCYDPYTEKFLEIFTLKEDQENKHNLYYEDHQKNIWLGSVSSGCSKITFNGKNFSVTNYTTKSPGNKLPSNTVNDIFQDSKMNTWILTSGGIIHLVNNVTIPSSTKDTSTDEFLKAYEINKKVYFISEKGKIIIYNLKTSKFEQSRAVTPGYKVFKTSLFNNKIFTSTYNKGIYIYNTITDSYSSSEKLFGEFIKGNAYFQTDKFGSLWTYNFSGNVWLLSPKNTNVVKLNLIPPSILQLIDEERYQMLADNKNNVWISTYGNGLFAYNLKTGNLKHFTHIRNTNGIASNYLLSIALDKDDNIWIGTENMGVNKLSFSNRNVKVFYPDPEETLRNGNVIRAFLEDHNHNVWVSTKAGNLYMYDSTLSNKKVIYNKEYNVYGMFEDKAGSVWLATKRNGIIELKNGNKSKATFYKKSEEAGSFSYNTVFSVTMDRKGRLWAATFGGGVCVKTSAEGTNGFKTFFTDDEWIKFARYVFLDKAGDIWVATSNGVLRFNPDELLLDDKAFRHYTFSLDNETSLANPEIRYIFQDSKGNMWFATLGGGLNLFEREDENGQGVFKTLSIPQGMVNDNIMGIQEDKDGNLWISTESGLHKYNPTTKLFQFFKLSDDFSANIFSETACLTRKNGQMLWGSLNGFYMFQPENFRLKSSEINKVVLSGFFIFDQEAKIDNQNAPLKQSITFSDKIELTSADKVFHIEFSNLNFRDPQANQYMYILDNYEKRWNVSSLYNIATYRNVPPGSYTFKVKSVNSEGAWDNNVTQLIIEIKPPFWESKIAYIIYFLLIVLSVYVAFQLIMKFNRLNNAVNVERQLTDYKLRFFTNISHEFRTPLTLIKGGVDTLMDLRNKMAEPLQQLVDDLDKNTSHMLRLIEQLLEFRKLQNNKQKLNLQRVDAIEFLDEIFKSFKNVATKMNIQYRYITSHQSLPIYFDKNKVDKIVFNLLSNAFKFTPRGGKITLTVKIDDTAEVLRISIADNGIGIPKEKQNLIFSRFMQINFSATGTGIGLSLVNEFTALHKGTVQYEENEGGGSVFTVTFPLNSVIYDKEDFVNEQIIVSKEDKKEIYNLSDFIELNEGEQLLNFLPNTPGIDKKYKVLVIDDNDDIRMFLNEKLSPYFEIKLAEDGDKGFEMGKNDDPDLIICDVMMPGMNGFELTKKLKDNFETCHIPVVLLTAYIADEHHTEGIEAGADAYISKPFSMKHLMMQINKLLEKRERLHKHYSGEDIDETSDEISEDIHDSLPEKDNVFLQRVEEFMEKNLTNPDFSVDDFAQLMNTGRTLFFKKIKSLTGYTPNEFIRVRRLKKAAELLKTYKYNVSEVSYMVGINDPFYFSKCFKAQFGCSPSKYLKS